MTQLFCASSAASVAFLAAAIDSGSFGPGHRVLLVSDESATPEVSPLLGPDGLGAPGPDRLLDRWDAVVSWNELIAPLHPAQWRPPAPEVPLLARLIAPVLSCDPIDELVVESITTGAGRALALLVPDVPITVASHGAEAYAPPVARAPSDVTECVERLLYLDLVPGLTPRLRAHPGVRAEAVAVEAYRRALAVFPVPAAETVLLGSAFAVTGLLTADEEASLQAEGIRALAASGVRDVGFAPHPAADPIRADLLRDASARSGVRLTMFQTIVPHEAWLDRPETVLAGWAEPVLLRADRATTFDLDALLDRPGPYERPERMALTLVDATVAKVGRARPETDVDLLADAVSFCLAPAAVPELRDRAQTWVAAHGTAPYLRKTRLTGAGAAENGGAGSRPRRSPLGRRRRS